MKPEAFANHFKHYFTSIEENDWYHHPIEHTEETPNENSNEPDGRITPTAPKEIQKTT